MIFRPYLPNLQRLDFQRGRKSHWKDTREYTWTTHLAIGLNSWNPITAEPSSIDRVDLMRYLNWKVVTAITRSIRSEGIAPSFERRCEATQCQTFPPRG